MKDINFFMKKIIYFKPSLHSIINSSQAACASGSSASETGWTCSYGGETVYDGRCNYGTGALLWREGYHYACMSGTNAVSTLDPCSVGTNPGVSFDGNICLSGGDLD
ncbi:MAG: hypothetical protein ABIA04_16095 [Pseudomonadota bacterium]